MICEVCECADYPAVILPTCTWGEQWRHECEVKWVLTLSKARRDQYWKDIEQWRGRKERDRLFNAAREEYDRRRGND